MVKFNKSNKTKKNRKNPRGFRRERGPTSASLVKKTPVVRYTPDVYGFPDRLQTRLRYSDFSVITLASGVFNTQVFRINSTFDPDFTRTGHQPLFRDTYASVYDQYSVISAVAHITLMNLSATTAILCGAVIDDDTSITSLENTIMEQSHGISAVLTPLSGSRSQWKFTVPWSCKGILGIDPYMTESYKTPVGSNPTEVSTLAIWGESEDQATTNSLHWKMELVQTVLWTELTTPTQS